jgi:D-alanyl-D-alanine carboxypeptidase
VTTAGLGIATAVAISTTPVAAQSATPAANPLDRAALQQTLDAIHDAGMYGSYTGVRDGQAKWEGATGVADVRTERPTTPRMVHRVGSITKTFTAVAILQQVARGKLALDAPIARYLPDLIPGELGQAITPRMLLNHTSGIGDYISSAFPSFMQGTTQSLDDNRFRTIAPTELARFGLAAPRTGAPGERWSYSNANYIIAGLLLEKVTGDDAESHITRNVIRKVGLRNTSFPRTPVIPGPHSKAYESMYGIIDPPRDYSVYNMSWAGTAGAMTSTMDDLNTFYRALLGGRLLPAPMLAEMQRTVPVLNAQGNVILDYGLGLYAMNLPCGRFWGHDGAIFGMGTQHLSSPDGRRQVSFGMNLMKYQQVNEAGQIMTHAIDIAMETHLLQALCGSQPAEPGLRNAPAIPMLPIERLSPIIK